jgi:hypothetical protein
LLLDTKYEIEQRPFYVTKDGKGKVHDLLCLNKIMTSIATQLGDDGQTSLVGQRVSKGALRVESYGTVDELNAALGFARSICGDEAIGAERWRFSGSCFRWRRRWRRRPGARAKRR